MKKLLLLIVASCVSFNALAEPIQIGAILPLSGEVAPWGQRVQIGLETANELHGHKFAITYEDEGAREAQKAITAYRKLISIDFVWLERPTLR